MHESYWRRSDDPLTEKSRDTPPARCAVSGCEREVRSAGLCQPHDEGQHHGPPLDTPIHKQWHGAGREAEDSATLITKAISDAVLP